MKTLPEVLHFWKSLVSSVRNCNTSTPHRLAADSATGPLARSRAHSPDRGGPGLARPGVPPGLLPLRPARGRLARPVTGRSPERRAPKPRPCGYAARRGPTCSLSSSTIAPLSSTPRSRAGSAALAHSLTHALRSACAARGGAKRTPPFPPAAGETEWARRLAHGGRGRRRPPRETPPRRGERHVSHAPPPPRPGTASAALRRAVLRLLAPRPAGVALLERAVRTADPRGESRGLGRR